MQIDDIYKHFKGKEYRIVGLSYCCDGDHLIPRIEFIDNETGMRFSRRIVNFFEVVDRPDYKYKGPRFTFLRRD